MNHNSNLLAAAKKGDSVTVQALLNKGAEVNLKSDYDKTSLAGAEKEGYPEIVELLKTAEKKE